MDIGRFRQFFIGHRLSFAIGIVVLITLLMTVISMSLYNTSGTASLDLSRPGYTQVRDQVIDKPTGSFQAIGLMDEQTATDFKKLFDSQRKALSGLGDFTDASLEDTSLQLGPQAQ